MAVAVISGGGDVVNISVGVFAGETSQGAGVGLLVWVEQQGIGYVVELEW